MTYKRKCFTISLIVFIAGLIFAFFCVVLLNKTGYSDGLDFYFSIPWLVMGLHTLFGKYVYFRGEDLTDSKKIIIGLCFIVIPLIVVLIRMITR